MSEYREWSRMGGGVLDEVPGVWERGGMFRVPPNACIPRFSVPEHHQPDTEVLYRRSCAELCRIISSSEFPDWLKDFLMPHQEEILHHALSKAGFHAWAAPGSGKTLVGILWLAKYSRHIKLVVTKAAARGTWKEEVRRDSSFKPVLLLGKTPPNKIDPDPNAIYITAYETLIDWADFLKKNLMPKDGCSLVFDEVHMIKNHKRTKPVLQSSGRTKWVPIRNMAGSAQKIAERSARRLGLSATTIPNTLIDLWSILHLVEPWAWGTRHKWGVQYAAGFKDAYGWKYPGVSNAEELLERLKWSKYKIPRCAVEQNLPPKRRQIVYLTPDEQNAPAGFKRDIQKASKTGERTHVFETLLQEAASRKRKYVLERIQEAVSFGQKVAVFTGRRADCERLVAAASKKLTPDVLLLWAHGGIPSDERDRIRHEYMNSSGPTVLIGTGHAWGESVNLQDTDLALFVMLPWTPRNILQWEGRFSRLGQKRPVMVSYIIAEGTVDEHVADILLDKLPAVHEIGGDEAAQGIEEAFIQSGDDLLSRISKLI